MTIDELTTSHNTAVDIREWLERDVIADVQRRYPRDRPLSETDMIDLLTLIAGELPDTRYTLKEPT